ncbi:hypothetical protein [Streptomyces sp. NBC_01314]|uniref:zinc finger domain-containing protein n=1 Tax=Streptomyces sp. NBC_01314 TaxID=2903821 RepID=UPI003091DD58|nr:hypothetical protein OG622_10890 [Streptomyces sp. NBC_01314]
MNPATALADCDRCGAAAGEVCRRVGYERTGPAWVHRERWEAAFPPDPFAS